MMRGTTVKKNLLRSVKTTLVDVVLLTCHCEEMSMRRMLTHEEV